MEVAVLVRLGAAHPIGSISGMCVMCVMCGIGVGEGAEQIPTAAGTAGCGAAIALGTGFTGSCGCLWVGTGEAPNTTGLCVA